MGIREKLTVALTALMAACVWAELPLAADSWPMFRGSQALLGVSKVQFPANTFGRL